MIRIDSVSRIYYRMENNGSKYDKGPHASADNQVVVMDMISWSVAAPAVTAAFVASLVEVVEAFTIVLAVASVRGWRPAATGTFAALGVLGLLIVALGPLLDRHASADDQVVVMDMISWGVAAPAVTAAFVASLVEVVEAFTIVLAVASVRGWRPAATGTFAALGVLGLLIVALGPLLDRVPLHLLQFVIGVLLLLFGMGWLRKAVLRSAGIIPLHDEDAVFAAETEHLAEEARRKRTSLDWIAGLAAFKAVLLEGRLRWTSSPARLWA